MEPASNGDFDHPNYRNLTEATTSLRRLVEKLPGFRDFDVETWKVGEGNFEFLGTFRGATQQFKFEIVGGERTVGFNLFRADDEYGGYAPPAVAEINLVNINDATNWALHPSNDVAYLDRPVHTIGEALRAAENYGATIQARREAGEGFAPADEPPIRGAYEARPARSSWQQEAGIVAGIVALVGVGLWQFLDRSKDVNAENVAYARTYAELEEADRDFRDCAKNLSEWECDYQRRVVEDTRRELWSIPTHTVASDVYDTEPNSDLSRTGQCVRLAGYEMLARDRARICPADAPAGGQTICTAQNTDADIAKRRLRYACGTFVLPQWATFNPR